MVALKRSFPNLMKKVFGVLQNLIQKIKTVLSGVPAQLSEAEEEPESQNRSVNNKKVFVRFIKLQKILMAILTKAFGFIKNLVVSNYKIAAGSSVQLSLKALTGVICLLLVQVLNNVARKGLSFVLSKVPGVPTSFFEFMGTFVIAGATRSIATRGHELLFPDEENSESLHFFKIADSKSKKLFYELSEELISTLNKAQELFGDATDAARTESIESLISTARFIKKSLKESEISNKKTLFLAVVLNSLIRFGAKEFSIVLS